MPSPEWDVWRRYILFRVGDGGAPHPSPVLRKRRPSWSRRPSRIARCGLSPYRAPEFSSIVSHRLSLSEQKTLRAPPGALARLNTCLGSHDEKLSLGENNKPILGKKGKSSTSTKRRSSLEETAPAKRRSRAAPLARLSETTQLFVFRASQGARTSRPPSCSSFWEWVSSRCAPAAAVRWGGRAHHASAAHTPSPAPTGGETTCSSQGST